jgi:hypothetical protein
MMKSKLDPAYLSIIAALGLELACASRPVGDDESDDSGTDGNVDAADSSDSTSTSTTTGDGDGDSGDGDGDSGDGDGDGDGDSGDGDGEPGDGDGDDPPPDPFECLDPTPIMQAGTELPSGFVTCDNGFIHRVEAVECVTPQGPDTPSCADWISGCQTSADCIDEPHGSCTTTFWGECACHYGCVSDADCEPGTVCACAGVMGESAQCLPAECSTSEGCDGGLCGLSFFSGICGDSYSLACAATDDECHVDADCGEAECPNGPANMQVPYYCTGHDGEGFSCQPPGLCLGDCGRPFLVGGCTRTATAIERDDWCTITNARPVGGRTRQQLAEYWTQVGQFEHASVASFARFAMHLLELGAPPRLLLETQRAMADEIEHARLAFGLASHYAGARVGPGALDVGDALGVAGSIDRHAIIEALVLEACVGETLAAIEAREAAAHAKDPAVAIMLEQIAADELRHAQLGWRALRWMLDTGDHALLEFALAQLDAAMLEVEIATSASELPASLREHGVLDDALRAELRREGIERLIRPCVAALRGHYQLATLDRAA